jgi:heptosyltransferase-2
LKIAVYSPNWVGDAALSLPFIHSVKEKYPNSEIIIICKEWVHSVYQNNPNIDKIMTILTKDSRGMLKTFQLGFLLRKEDIKIFYTLTDSFRSAFVLWLSNSKKRIGYNVQGRGVFLTDKIELSTKKNHRSKKYLKLVGQDNFLSDDKLIYLKKDEINWAKQEIEKIGIESPVALFPFSVSDVRTFPNEKISEWLGGSKEHYLIFGSKNDKEKALTIIKENKNISITSICGTYSLRQSIVLISICKYAIAADSGLGHISSIIKVPTISFFGANRSSVTKPLGSHCLVIDKSNRCNPCKKNICCLNSINRADVDSSINSLTLDL